MIHLGEDGNDGAESNKGAPLELEKARAVGGSPLGEDAHWVVIHSIFFDHPLTLYDLLYDLLAGHSVSSSIDEKTLQTARTNSNKWPIGCL